MCFPLGVVGLAILANYSHEYWVFAIVALVGWSTGALARRAFEVESAATLRQFIALLFVILGASTFAAWLSSWLVQGENGALSLGRFIGVVFANAVAIALVLYASDPEVQSGYSYD